MTLSPDAAQFLLDLLCRQQISVGADDFEVVVAVVAKAKAELRSAIDAALARDLLDDTAERS